MLRILICFVMALALPSVAHAAVRLAPILSNHMVLQRNMPVPIWGTALPGEKVSVKFRNQEKSTEADSGGKWSVKLDPLSAGGPEVLTVVGANTITVEDVLVGEVWIGSGQSNMDGRPADYVKNDPGLVKVIEGAPYPQIRMSRARGPWTVADKDSIPAFSALLLPFGVRLQQGIGVPVGLVLGAFGGTPSGSWLTEEMLKSDPLCQEQTRKALEGFDLAKAHEANAATLKQWEADVAQAKAENKQIPRRPLLLPVPGEMRTRPFVGDWYEGQIKPMVPFAARGVLWDQGEGGTDVVGVDQFAVTGALIKGWRKAWEIDFPFVCVQKPSGGGPAFDPDCPITSRADKFVPLPFAVPADIGEYREMHLRLREHPNTFLVTASDLGSGTHPLNKSGYALRAARVALGAVYGEPLEIYGPIYKSHAVDGERVRVSFSHATGGLKVIPAAKLQGFALAGEDKQFHWADAVIEGDSVVLTCAKVARPVAVRYAWAPAHPWANLFNGDGLPTLPFKTDR